MLKLFESVPNTLMYSHVHSPVGLGVLPKDHRTLHVFKILLIARPLLS